MLYSDTQHRKSMPTIVMYLLTNAISLCMYMNVHAFVLYVCCLFASGCIVVFLIRFFRQLFNINDLPWVTFYVDYTVLHLLDER